MKRSARNGIYLFASAVVFFAALELWHRSWVGTLTLGWALLSLGYWIWRDRRERPSR